MKFNYSDSSRYKIGESLFYPQPKKVSFEIKYEADVYASVEPVLLIVKTNNDTMSFSVFFDRRFELNMDISVHGMVEFYIETPNWAVNPIGSILTVKEIKQSEI